MQKSVKTCESAGTNYRAFYNYTNCHLFTRIQ